jgi:hypothetical protein
VTEQKNKGDYIDFIKTLVKECNAKVYWCDGQTEEEIMDLNELEMQQNRDKGRIPHVREDLCKGKTFEIYDTITNNRSEPDLQKYPQNIIGILVDEGNQKWYGKFNLTNLRDLANKFGTVDTAEWVGKKVKYVGKQLLKGTSMAGNYYEAVE